MSNFEDYSEAVIQNDLATVKRSFNQHYLYCVNQNGFPIFVQACHLGLIDSVKFFIEKEADLEQDTQFGWTGLHWAANSGHVEIVLLLLEKGANKECETNKKLRPLHCSVINDQHSTLRVLLVQGCDYNAKNKENKTPLDVATDLKNDKCVSLLKKWIEYDKIFLMVRQHQVDKFNDAFLHERVNVKEKTSGMTVVDVAVESKSLECLEKIMLHDLDEKIVVTSVRCTLNRLNISVDCFLAQYRLYRSIILNLKEQFDKFALVDIVNSPWILTGESFLDKCVQFNREDMAVSVLQMLLKEDQILNNAENIAKMRGFARIKDIVIRRKKYLESKRKASYNRLHVAIQDNRVDVVRHIVANHLIDANGHHPVVGVPLCFALSLGFGDCVQVLLDHGVNVNVRNKCNQTPLHLAIENGLSQFNQILIDRLNDVDQRDSFGFTALHQATINNEDDTCLLLLDKGANLINPLKIPQDENADDRLMCAFPPLLQNENPVTLSLKLHRTIMPSLMAHIDICSVNVVADDGSSFLHLAARLFLADICSTLINKGANINSLNYDENTPLHSLFTDSVPNSWHNEGFKETLLALVVGGANINLLNKAGVSPFRYAFQTEDKDILNIIISHCDKLDSQMDDFFVVFNQQWPDIFEKMFNLQKDEFKHRLIVESVEKGMEAVTDLAFSIVTTDFADSIIEDCLYNAATVDNETIFNNFTNRNLRQPKFFPPGQTLLTKLIVENNLKYSLKLVKSNLGERFVNFQNQNGHTPLYLSAIVGSLKLCKLLVLDCDCIDYKDNDGETALEKLFKSSTNTEDKDKLRKVEEIVKIMIQGGMDINRLNKAKTPAITFCQNENLKRKLQSFYDKKKVVRPPIANDTDNERNICDICLENPIDCQFGCGHPMCRTCAEQVDPCPMCRKPRTRIIPLYL